MPDVVAVRFKPCGKIYNFKMNGINPRPGLRVVVESEMGLGLGLIVKAKHHIEQPEQQLKNVLRIATIQDMETDKNNRPLETAAKVFCLEKVKNRNLAMKVVGTEATLDRKRLIFYFTADGRIDFRELVRDLASKFKTRIEMRQIGVRDGIKFIGGIGACGREVCCKTFLSSFEPVSIRMAKKQELVLNPGKLSGICSRLMCCLGYEIARPAKEKTAEAKTKDKTVGVTDKKIADSVPSHSTTPQSPETFKPSKERPSPPRLADKPEETKPKKQHKKPFKPQKKDRGKPFSKRKKFWKKKTN